MFDREQAIEAVMAAEVPGSGPLELVRREAEGIVDAILALPPVIDEMMFIGDYATELVDFGVELAQLVHKIEVLQADCPVCNQSVTDPLHMAGVHVEEARDGVARLLGNQVISDRVPAEDQ